MTLKKTSPAYTGFYFVSEEKEREFLEAPEEVKKTAMFLLDKCIKQSMKDLQDDYIIKAIHDLEVRVKILEQNK